MLRVQAHLQPLVAHRLQDRPQLLEAGPDVLAHARHVLHGQAGRVRCLVQRLPDPVGHLRQHRLEARPAVAARVEDQALGPEPSCQVQVCRQGIDALLQHVGPFRAQVDQVDGVQEHRPNTGIGLVLAERLDLSVRYVAEGPRLRRRAENLQGLAADFLAPSHRLADAPRRRYVRSDLQCNPSLRGLRSRISADYTGTGVGGAAQSAYNGPQCAL